MTFRMFLLADNDTKHKRTLAEKETSDGVDEKAATKRMRKVARGPHDVFRSAFSCGALRTTMTIGI